MLSYNNRRKKTSQARSGKDTRRFILGGGKKRTTDGSLPYGEERKNLKDMVGRNGFVSRSLTCKIWRKRGTVPGSKKIYRECLSGTMMASLNEARWGKRKTSLGASIHIWGIT